MVNDNDKKDIEMIKTAKEMIELMIIALNEELLGKESVLKNQALQYLELLIEKQKIDIEKEKRIEEYRNWEFENKILQEHCGEVYDWEFQDEWL